MIPEVNIYEILISNFLDKCVNVSIATIKRANSNRKIKNLDFQIRIYQVTIDAINRITFNKYKNQDIVYGAAEVLLLGFKSGNEDFDDIIGKTLIALGEIDVTENRKKFISVLNHEISKEENFDVYKEVLLTLLQMKENDNIDFQQINKKLEQITEILRIKNKNYERNVEIQNTKFQNNQRREYVEKWNDVLFLHRNQPIEKQVRLCDVYVCPEYKIEKKDEKLEDLDVFIDNFISGKTKRYSPVIILGDGGMGKTSLVSYICAKYEDEDTLIVVRFNDLNRLVLNNFGIWAALEKELCCHKEDFRSKRLILDGFDEAKIVKDRDKLLVEFLMDAANVRQLRVLITSRKHYVDKDKYSFCRILYIQFMSKELINSMCGKYAATTKQLLCKVENENTVIGIPFILYMILSLKIKVEKSTGLCELYEKIFALNDGIYDRLYDDDIHWISDPDIKTEVQEISQRFAFAMFEKQGLELTEIEYQKIVESVNADRMRDFAIANYYDIGTKLCFVHKSIFEYFLAEYIYQVIKRGFKNILRLPNDLANIFKKNYITKDIHRFLKFKIEKDKMLLCTNNYYSLVSTTNLMLEYGMSYFLNKNVAEKDIHFLYKEANIFYNMLEIISVFNQCKAKKYIDLRRNIDVEIRNLNIIFTHNVKMNYMNLQDLDLHMVELSDCDLMQVNLSHTNLTSSIFSRTNLTKANLTEANLTRGNFDGADLKRASLIRVNFNRAQLNHVDFEEADLQEVKFVRAKLYRANFKNADLRNSILTGSDLREADFEDANLEGSFLFEVDLNGANLNGANLTNVDLRESNLGGIDFDGSKHSLGKSIRKKIRLQNVLFDEKNIKIFLDVPNFVVDEILNTRVWIEVLKKSVSFYNYIVNYAPESMKIRYYKEKIKLLNIRQLKGKR